MIAIALSCDPKLILADEPTTALDVTIQAQILELIQRLSSEFGTAVLLITHDLGIAAGMCDRVNVMYAGRIVETGTVDTLFENPRMPYAWGLLDSLPRIDDVRGDRLRTIEGLPPLLIAPPKACRFGPRCPYIRDVCRENEPELTQRGRGALRPLLRDRARRVDLMTTIAPTPTDPAAPAAAPTPAARPAEHRRGRRPQGPFPDPGGDLQERQGRGQGGRRHHRRRPSWRDPGPRRRVRLRQEHHRPGDDPAPRRDRRQRPVRRRRPLLAQARRAAQVPPPDADHLPGPVRVARPADDGQRDRQRADRDPQPRPGVGQGRAGGRAADAWSASTRSTSSATPTSSPAASASASGSPARSRSSPSSSSATSRSPRSTCRSRPRSSTC